MGQMALLVPLQAMVFLTQVVVEVGVDFQIMTMALPAALA
jgi:hypothetical protein